MNHRRGKSNDRESVKKAERRVVVCTGGKMPVLACVKSKNMSFEKLSSLECTNHNPCDIKGSRLHNLNLLSHGGLLTFETEQFSSFFSLFSFFFLKISATRKHFSYLRLSKSALSSSVYVHIYGSDFSFSSEVGVSSVNLVPHVICELCIYKLHIFPDRISTYFPIFQ